ncbi:PqqD family protein [Streptomyces sp. NPDC050388]|uniref:PqqD family protein n=1 Tax=Streptomyces sp. NPDC050388 TaxID=3155781 RepID=UPI00341B5A57
MTGEGRALKKVSSERLALEVSVRFRPVPGVKVTSVNADGCLELLAESAMRPAYYRCGPMGAAMWIALCHHDGDSVAAANTLARMWHTDPVNAHADLEIWVEEMRDAGLICAEP